MKIFWKGRIVDALRARVPVFGHPYLQGSALAETMQVRAGKIVNLRLHLERLEEGARVLMMPPPDSAALASSAFLLLKLNRFREGALRCRYFRDASLLMHPLPASKKKAPSSPGIRLITTPVRHYGPGSIQGRLKANSMLPSLLARWESQAWAEDGLRLTEAGYVAEGVWSNLIIEKRGVLMTPPLPQGVLEGTTRAVAINRWRKKGGKVLEQPLTRYDLYTADKAWVCSSLRGMLRIASIDGRKLGGS